MRLEKYIVENLTLWQKLNSFAHKNIHTIIHTCKFTYSGNHETVF